MGVWFTTWPAKTGGIEYAEHSTEKAAADHADRVVRSRQADVATYFEHGALENSA